MRNHRRAALAAAPLSLALLLAACSDDDDSADRTTTTTTTTTTEAASPPSSAETGPTALPPSEGEPGDTTAPPSQAGDPLPTAGTTEWAAELVRAWGAGDRERAAELATPEVVDRLFGHADPGGDDWELLACDSTAVEWYCTFTSASRGESLTTQQGTDPIATVTFGTVTDDVTPELAGLADDLVQAWGAGDRQAALRVAPATDVDTLFRLADPGGPGWERTGCFSLDDDPQCTYEAPDRDETVIVHVGDDTPTPVAHVSVYDPG